jgi:hypothetical protein
MSIVTRTTAKTYFETGDVPTQQNFSDTLDSVNFKEDNFYTNVKDYGAVADAFSFSGASMTSGTNIITFTGGTWTTADIGKAVAMQAVGNSQTDLVGTITGVNSTSAITVSFTASVTQTNRIVTYGTDNTAAIMSAITAAPTGGVVMFSAGGYYIKTGLTINKTLTIRGTGGGCIDFTGPNTNKPATRIVTNNWTGRTFDVNAINVHFEHIGIENAVSNASGGAGIYFTNGIGFKLYDVSVRNFWTNVDMLNAYFWTIDKCFLISYHEYALRIESNAIPDAGDWCISNSWFYADLPITVQGSHIYQVSSGGGKILNCKFNAVLPWTPAYGYNGNVTGTVDLQISNCSFENIANTAIKIAGNPTFWNVTITGNQFAQGRVNTTDIDISNTDNFTITGNVFGAFDSSSTAVVIAGTRQYISNNAYVGYVGTKAPVSYTLNYSNTVNPAFVATNLSTATTAINGASYGMTGAADAAIIRYYPANYTNAALQNTAQIGTLLTGATVEIKTGTDIAFKDAAGNLLAKISGTTGNMALNGSLTSYLSINAQTVTGYTLTAADDGKIITMSHVSGNTVTVPQNSSVAFKIGTQITIVNLGAGQTSIVAGTGATVVSAGGALRLRIQNSTATLIKIATNTWLLTGDIIV